MSLKACSICKQEKLVSEFNKNKTKADGLQTHCKVCNKEKSKSYYKANQKKHRKVILKRKKKVVAETAQYVWNYLKQHPCVDCSESDPIVLDFDHIKGEKVKSVCALSRSGCCLEKVKAEIEKCEVRCANCHRRKTAKDFNWYQNIDTGQ